MADLGLGAVAPDFMPTPPRLPSSHRCLDTWNFWDAAESSATGPSIRSSLDRDQPRRSRGGTASERARTATEQETTSLPGRPPQHLRERPDRGWGLPERKRNRDGPRDGCRHDSERQHRRGIWGRPGERKVSSTRQWSSATNIPKPYAFLPATSSSAVYSSTRFQDSRRRWIREGRQVSGDRALVMQTSLTEPTA